MSNANAEFDKQDSVTNDDLPEGSDTVDDRYATPTDQEPIPVITDETPVEQPNLEGDPDSDETLRTLHHHNVSLYFPNLRGSLAQNGTRLKQWTSVTFFPEIEHVAPSRKEDIHSQVTRRVYLTMMGDRI
jgi:hypothetical protein